MILCLLLECSVWPPYDRFNSVLLCLVFVLFGLGVVSKSLLFFLKENEEGVYLGNRGCEEGAGRSTGRENCALDV